MAQYRITQTESSFRSALYVEDPYSGARRFVCRLSGANCNKKFRLERPDGQLVYSVRKRMMRILPRFDVYKGEASKTEPVSTVKVKFSLFNKKIKVSGPYGNYLIFGGKTDWDFTVYEGDMGGEIVATVSKRIGIEEDTYDIDIVRGKEIFTLTLCIIIDYLYRRKRK